MKTRTRFSHVAAGAALVAALVPLAACQARANRFPPAPAAGAASTAVNNCDDRDRNATLTGRVVMSFRGAARGEAVVRIVGESYESTVRIDVATGSTFELRQDSYRVRVDVDGYRTVQENVRVICGKESPLVIALNKR